ncbi:hypothetical protein VOLCADRAFT_121436 [Volvox carteri f. nagariensis]|uniref:Uncharacterized protein n=1 Tax=Volvox carteri f. nagariensis TaxID=3068 RepID=D8U9Z3_VOLCA|nr:uncharacterized protein VOLCADRAFT_121436 [Volvox carteri f. nagariensis]EFJ43557.1 hypothetical protein VOLCADRAFT_121436 [Volvox carteri f. nagariensis]|eukprot:XP_002955486.1 hypothetical protein VOLCADRAFT_121436 [Volvox carteri f. nagariensis]
MPPLPTLWDPAGAVDKLPQPFRMIDKVLADIVEQVVDLIGKREQQRKLEEAAKVNLTFAPHAVLEVPPETSLFKPLGIAGLAALALPDGELRVVSARDASSTCSDRTHTSPITAMESGLVVATSGRLLAAASRTTLSVHEVDIKTSGLTLLASVTLPSDPDDHSSPVRLHWSDTLGHLAVCYDSGALALYGVSLPVPDVDTNGLGALMAMQLHMFGPTRLTELLRVPLAAVKALCLDSPSLGSSQLMWQQQHRPDKAAHSDRYHKTARGLYIWWEGSSRLLLVDIAAAAAAAAAAASSASAAAVRPAPEAEPSTASGTSAGKAAPGSKAVNKAAGGGGDSAAAVAAAAAAAGANPVVASAPPPGEPCGPPRTPQVAPLARDWILPYNITAAAATSDRRTLAWGLADGSVLLLDDRAGCTTKVLPRLRGAITALAWVNGVAHKLMCASAAGDIFIADIIKPEDSSQKPYEFPQPIHAIYFLPNEPFALCVCRGHTSSDGELAANGSASRNSVGGAAAAAAGSGSGSGGSDGGCVGNALAVKAVRPRIMWYNVLEEKPVAELMGPQAGQSFGLACCVPPPPPPPPPRPPSAPEAPTSPSAGSATGGGGSRKGTPEPPSPHARQAMMAALAAMGANVHSGPQLVQVPLPVPAGQVVPYPALAVTDTYLLVGGDLVDKVVYSNFADADAVPQRILLLYMYKVDALLRHLLPEDETHSRLGRVVLDRLLADLEAPKVNKRKGKRVTLDVEDTDTPKLPSSMRKPDPFDPAAPRPAGRAANRHITFGAIPDELFDDAGKVPKETKKVFPKETKKGLKTGPDDPALANKDRRGSDGKPRLAPLDLEKAREAPPAFQERSQSPPWHHTNPLARIHPDWEEAPVLIRIMERIGSKGGGRKRREKRLDTLTGEMMAKYAKEAGAKPNLLVT